MELVGRGAGITGHPELMETLEGSGAGTKDLGVEMPKRIAIDREGRITDERPLRQILTSWDRLQRLLRATINESRHHLGWNFERVDQDERGVRVQFSGGRVEHADILIGGDGIRSSVRAQMAPEVQPVYAGYYIWRGAPNEADLEPETSNSIYPLFTFYLPKRQQVITYPISGFDNDLRPGKRRFNFIYEAVLDRQEDGLKLIWVFDNRAPQNPVSISTFPTPAEADYNSKGGHFGPHNIHENRPGSFVSSQLTRVRAEGNRCARVAAAADARRRAPEPRA